MVDGICRDMEREILSPTNSFSTNSGAHDRCQILRDMGLWCMVRAELVSGFVEPPCRQVLKFSIAARELIPIVLACEAWRLAWLSCEVQV